MAWVIVLGTGVWVARRASWLPGQDSREARACGDHWERVEGQRNLSGFQEEAFKEVRAVWEQQYEAISGGYSGARPRYDDAEMILFSGEIRTVCGECGPGLSPFYCALDDRLYLDPGDLAGRGSPGQPEGRWVQATLMAAALGHRVLDLLGVTDRVHRQRDWVAPEEWARLKWREELHVAYLAGVGLHHASEGLDLAWNDPAVEALGLTMAERALTEWRVRAGRLEGRSESAREPAELGLWLRRGLESGDPAEHNPFERGDGLSDR